MIHLCTKRRTSAPAVGLETRLTTIALATDMLTRPPDHHIKQFSTSKVG